MKSMFSRALLALVAALAVGAVGASAALASPEWYVKQGGVYSPVTETLEVPGHFAITLTRYSAGMQFSSIECRGSLTGTVAPGGVGTIDDMTTIECLHLQGACKAGYVVKAENLSWGTDLYAGEKEGEIRYAIGNGGFGQPTYRVECGEGEIVACALETNAKEREKGRSPADFRFDSASPQTSCNVGLGETASWGGRIIVEPPAGAEGITAL